MSARKERRYQAEDLEDMLKADLVNIIKGQISKWPGGNFNHSKLTKAKLEAAILENEFTLMEAAPVDEAGELETGEWVVDGKVYPAAQRSNMVWSPAPLEGRRVWGPPGSMPGVRIERKS
ncbi:hypothetical protein K438DRAFT_1785292 [Mycena galopus ATCC 62051]|nr:hypothetical protein K438DRAFT_1785292 [Mycena galopus ATCC 62051]